jgi:hypothetical protein
MLRRCLAAAGVSILAFATLAPAQQDSLSPSALRAWLTYLSSDELEGRAVFSEGLGLAAAYIASQLKEAGVKPGGDNGSYFQRVEVQTINTTRHSTLTVEVNGQQRTFEDGKGITFPLNVGAKRSLTLDQVQFTGYGLNLSDEHDDYQDLDVKGKVVVWLGLGPKGPTLQQLRRQLNARAAYAILERGAAASIGVPNAPPANPPAILPPLPVEFTTVQPLNMIIEPNVTARDEFLEFLFSASEMSYAQLKAKADQHEELPRFALKNVKLTFNLDADYKVITTRYTRNVVGIVEGTDLKNSYVALGAHYDHTGYTQGVLAADRTDRINNGADDDGSGTTALIGLARTFASGPPIKRSLLFVWHTGEESGLWGSRYHAEHPVAPLADIVAQLNIDMIGRRKDNLDAESNTLYLVGADRISSELHNLTVDANASLTTPMILNFELNDSRDPERVYYRSDHYSYATKGIPIVFFTSGLHPDYHRVSDTVEKIDFEKLAHTAQLIHETGRRLANLDHAPARDYQGPRKGKGGSGKIALN